MVLEGQQYPWRPADGCGSQGTEFTWEPLLFPCLSPPSGEPSSLFSLGRSGLEFLFFFLKYFFGCTSRHVGS